LPKSRIEKGTEIRVSHGEFVCTEVDDFQLDKVTLASCKRINDMQEPPRQISTSESHELTPCSRISALDDPSRPETVIPNPASRKKQGTEISLNTYSYTVIHF
jgi:hypothetical protein